MSLLLATQGSQGIVAIRELFASGTSPEDIHVAICNPTQSRGLIEFVRSFSLRHETFGSEAEFNKWFTERAIELAQLVSVSWCYRFNSTVLSKFKQAAINLHPGLLPEYRGCFSIPWAMINGEKQVGYTYHYMVNEFDTGNILIREGMPITQSDTAFTLNHKVFQRALSRLGEAIKLLGTEGTKQTSAGMYYRNELPYRGMVDSSWPEAKKDLFARAMHYPPFKGAIENINGVATERLPKGLLNV